MEKMTIPGILLAGLLDGINPCAISILMVFYSFLMITENKRKIVLMSSMFISGIFLANFTFGLGFKAFYNVLAGNYIVMYLLYGMAILMCITAIVLNTIDIINHKKEIVKNQLPDTIKYKMVNLLRRNVFSKFAVVTSIVVGFVIGAVELACTGQIYFPTLTYMIQSTNYGPKSILLLVLYNIMFVLPLIIITVIAGCIKQPEQIKGAIMKKNWIIKLVANIFFVIMSIILLKQILII
jgi:cytochrome c biogenesis protein CcdA